MYNTDLVRQAAKKAKQSHRVAAAVLDAAAEEIAHCLLLPWARSQHAVRQDNDRGKCQAA